VPYWIDDHTLIPYMLMCAEATSENNEEAAAHTRTSITEPPAALIPGVRRAELHPVHRKNSHAVDLFSTDDFTAPPRVILSILVNLLSDVGKLTHQKRLSPISAEDSSIS
jgi:hypothetical protein